MPFTDSVRISFVMFNKHVNLGGESSKFLQAHGQLVRLELLSNGMVKVVKPSGVFFVAAACIESCEEEQMRITAENAEAGAEKADLLKEKAAKSTKPRNLAPISVKLADSSEHMTRAEEILAELTSK